MSAVRGWASDLALGIRLAVGGGRTSKTGVVRLLLGTIGVGLAVLVLLIAAAVQPGMQARGERDNARAAITTPVPGVDPLYLDDADTKFRGVDISRNYVHATGPNAPLPPGVDRIPAPGEYVVSPALAQLLASPEGELLRPRFPGRPIGTIGSPGLIKPTDLSAYVGAAELPGDHATVYKFGAWLLLPEVPPQLLVGLVFGLVTLLIPVFIFVASSARVAGAERDRRLAALRLVGSSARQVRRIAAAESLVSAVLGLLLGGGLFLALRASAADIVIANESFFPADLTPAMPLIALILISVPALAMLTTQFALRSSIIEPLGVVRVSKPIRRRVLWRLMVLVVGATMLLFADGERADDTSMMILIIGGASLLLISVPTMLPWLLERLVSRFNGSGKPSFQLAVRRLQLDTATPARVVGGLAVVLAGVIALQTVLAGQMDKYGGPVTPGSREMFFVNPDNEVADAVSAVVANVPGVTLDYMVASFVVRSGGPSHGNMVSVADCPMLSKILVLDRCVNGDAFTMPLSGPFAIKAGGTLQILDPYYLQNPDGDNTVGTLQLPSELREAKLRPGPSGGGGYSNVGSILLTPAALHATPGVKMESLGAATVNGDRPDATEDLRNALEPFSWHVELSDGATGAQSVTSMFLDIRKGLLIGSLFTLLLAGVSLLVVALEQMRERRRAIAALSATGVPISTLVRSLLWQNTIPMLLAVTVAVATGVGLAALVFRLMTMRFTMDWANIGLMSATAMATILLVTALTLPTLRSATRLTALRTE